MEYEDHLRFGTVGAPASTPGTGTCAAIEHTACLGLLVDGTIVQAHQKAAGARGGLRLKPSGARAAG